MNSYGAKSVIIIVNKLLFFHGKLWKGIKRLLTEEEDVRLRESFVRDKHSCLYWLVGRSDYRGRCKDTRERRDGIRFVKEWKPRLRLSLK